MTSFCLIGDTGRKLFGLDTASRLRRQIAGLDACREVDLAAAAAESGKVVFIRADAAIDQPLLPALAAAEDVMLVGDGQDTQPAIAVCVVGARSNEARSILQGAVPAEKTSALARKMPSELNANFWKSLRKREVPYAVIVSEENAKAVEWRMFMGTYKGATDIVTKHLWPWPAFHVTRWLAPLGVTPNMVTAIAAILTALAFWLFLEGHFALGLIAAWAMTFLDTVDGKLARATLTSSKWGDIFDHGIDLVHPPFWYVAWALGLAQTGLALSMPAFWWVMAVILGGYVVQRIFEGISIVWLGLEIHIWRPIDTLFRQITARRNPNLVILTLAMLIGRPDWGLISVAIWTAVCLALHLLQLLQALAAKKNGPLSSWLMRP